MNENIQNSNNKEQNGISSQKQDINIETNLSSNQENNENDAQILEKIKQFFWGPYIDENNTIHDISYTTWVEKDINIKKLCTPFEVVLPTDNNIENQNNDPFGILTRHDYGCELKLIKWITEDETHKNNFIKVGNKGTKINRHLVQLKKTLCIIITIVKCYPTIYIIIWTILKWMENIVRIIMFIITNLAKVKNINL